MRSPVVVRVEKKTIRTLRGNGKRRCVRTHQTYYAVLDFGGEIKRLHISATAARWIAQRRDRDEVRDPTFVFVD